MESYSQFNGFIATYKGSYFIFDSNKFDSENYTIYHSGLTGNFEHIKDLITSENSYTLTTAIPQLFIPIKIIRKR